METTKLSTSVTSVGRRIGILGGTFDPIHKGHVALAHETARKLSLDLVMLIPAGNPPHKPDTAERAAYEDRFRMTELACAGDSLLQASRLEEGMAKSYTFHSIGKLRELLRPDDTFYLILGADAFADIRTWFRWQDVVKLVRFAVATRPGYRYEIPDGARVETVDTLDVPYSSSKIRREIAAGRRPDGLHDAVWTYINARGLYSPSS